MEVINQAGYVAGASVSMSLVQCCQCQMPFMVTKQFERDRRNDHRNFYCPAGHDQHYPGKSELEKAREAEKWAKDQLIRERASFDQSRQFLNDQIKTAKRSRNAVKGQLTKTKNRITKGVCSCCNRYFKNLHSHMVGQHPDYTAADVTDETK